MIISRESRRVMILGVLALLLGGYTYVTTPEQKLPAAHARQQQKERPIFEFHPEKVSQLDVIFDGQHLVGKRTPEGWQQAQSGEPLPSAVVDDFLAALVRLVDLGGVEGKPEDLSDYGLKPPKTQISVQVDGAGTQTLALGKHNPVSTSLYALVNQSQNVILVGSIVSWDLRKLMDAVKSLEAAQRTTG